VEFEADFGTPVYAAADGTVLFAGADDQPVYSPWRNYYGNLVVIQHVGDIFTLYAHLSKIEVKAEARVQAGDKLGEVGQSGVAIGSHLHFEVRRGNAHDFNSTANPELWLIVRRADAGGMSLTLVNDGRVVPQTAITLQRYSASGQPVETYYFDTYHPSLEFREENAGIGDLPAGKYRVTLIYNSHLYERWVEVQSGKLTQVVIVVE
jgi:murein DD-endopeptidase MepM/ murein hydrolase activator NlpD